MESIQSHTTESQPHGKTIENIIKNTVYGIDKIYHHTSVHDIEADDNNITQKNVSVKSTCVDKKIDCGDVLRFLRLENTEIDVAYYIQHDECKEIMKTYVVDYGKFLENLKVDIKSEFNMDFEDWIGSNINDYVRNIKSIPSGRVEDKWYKTNKPPTPSYFNICPKVDSRSQRRVQCSITDFTRFIIQENEGSVLHGVKYNSNVMCGRRVRHSKK